jgi:hypothetical protein
MRDQRAAVSRARHRARGAAAAALLTRCAARSAVSTTAHRCRPCVTEEKFDPSLISSKLNLVLDRAVQLSDDRRIALRTKIPTGDPRRALGSEMSGVDELRRLQQWKAELLASLEDVGKLPEGTFATPQEEGQYIRIMVGALNERLLDVTNRMQRARRRQRASAWRITDCLCLRKSALDTGVVMSAEQLEAVTGTSYRKRVSVSHTADLKRGGVVGDYMEIYLQTCLQFSQDIKSLGLGDKHPNLLELLKLFEGACGWMERMGRGSGLVGQCMC